MNHYDHYDGDDLGAVYNKDRTRFRVWAPTALHMKLKLYPSGHEGEATVFEMEKDTGGTWVKTLAGDYHGVYYTYQVSHAHGDFEVVDPYAKAVGVNGNRGMVIDLSRTNPEGWDELVKPEFKNFTDAVIYEVHVRDLTIQKESGIKHRGKYLGVIERGTRGPKGVKTGLDHLVELGITHLHLLPVQDFYTIDESKPSEPMYNWGYDPKNYNAPEGWYATDPYHGEIRIREFKEMVMGLNRTGIRVVMDVVYNHTYQSEDSNFNRLVPGYYYRMTPDGAFSNGSGCGNETASERFMVRKFIIDSVVYWATEYKIDGFRFDLMGLHDVETMNLIRQALDKIRPGILLYGEGWTGGLSPLPEKRAALKKNIIRMPGIAAFNDDFRDGIKGPVFVDHIPGFAGGGMERRENVKFGITGACGHTGVNCKEMTPPGKPWAGRPGQSINYVESHDNLTLWDRLLCTHAHESDEERIKIHRLCACLILTSQGIPFLHAGQDFLRTKYGDHNSYRSPDHVNQLDWFRKAQYLDVFHYYRGLIALRRAHPAFRMTCADQVQKHLKFLNLPPDMVGYTLSNHANNDPWRMIAVLFNTGKEKRQVSLPAEKWVVVVDGTRAGTGEIRRIHNSQVKIPPRTSLVLVDAESYDHALPNRT